MLYNEVEQLRKSGNLEDAYEKALADLKIAIRNHSLPETLTNRAEEEQHDENPESESPLIVGKRAFAWVLYDYLKKYTSRECVDDFIGYLREFTNIELEKDEKMVVNQLVWLIGKSVFEFTKEPGFEISKVEELAELTMKLNFSKQTKGYSFLFKGFHKALKESPMYIDFVSWWGLKSFIRDDYKFTRQQDGKKIMAIVEQGCNRYIKTLVKALDNATDFETAEAIRNKLRDALPQIEEILKYNKYYRKLPQHRVMILIALGKIETVFSTLKAHAKVKFDDFWVWEMMSEAYTEEPEKQIACLSTALLCRAKPEKIIAARVQLSALLIEAGDYDEAKTEMAQILMCCHENKWDIPENITDWGEQPWYALAKVNDNNYEMYESYQPVAEEIIYSGLPQQKVVVEAVNYPKKILNFLGLDYTRGYFKYDRILKNVNEGDVLLVRIKETDMEGRYNLHNAKKINEKLIEGILKYFSGRVSIPANKPFGFTEDMFITPDVCSKHQLSHGDTISGRAMMSYNKKKDEWGWKVISID